MNAQAQNVLEDLGGLVEGLCPCVLICLLIVAGALAALALVLAAVTCVMACSESRKAKRILGGELKVSTGERKRLARSLKDSGDPQNEELARRLNPHA